MKKFLSFIFTTFFVVVFYAQNSSNELIDNGGVGKFCGVVIVLADQDNAKYNSSLTTTKICYTHDVAGNLSGTANCNSSSFVTKKAQERTNKTEETHVQEGPLDLGDSFVAYPNPTDGLFYLAWNKNAATQLASMQLASVNTGRIIPVAYKNTDKITTIDLSKQPSGIYILRVVFTNGTTKSIKVIRK